jgi:hypothetical protein
MVKLDVITKENNAIILCFAGKKVPNIADIIIYDWLYIYKHKCLVWKESLEDSRTSGASST